MFALHILLTAFASILTVSAGGHKGGGGGHQARNHEYQEYLATVTMEGTTLVTEYADCDTTTTLPTILPTTTYPEAITSSSPPPFQTLDTSTITYGVTSTEHIQTTETHVNDITNTFAVTTTNRVETTEVYTNDVTNTYAVTQTSLTVITQSSTVLSTEVVTFIRSSETSLSTVTETRVYSSLATVEIPVTSLLTVTNPTTVSVEVPTTLTSQQLNVVTTTAPGSNITAVVTTTAPGPSAVTLVSTASGSAIVGTPLFFSVTTDTLLTASITTETEALPASIVPVSTVPGPSQIVVTTLISTFNGILSTSTRTLTFATTVLGPSQAQAVATSAAAIDINTIIDSLQTASLVSSNATVVFPTTRPTNSALPAFSNEGSRGKISTGLLIGAALLFYR